MPLHFTLELESNKGPIKSEWMNNLHDTKWIKFHEEVGLTQNRETMTLKYPSRRDLSELMVFVKGPT